MSTARWLTGDVFERLTEIPDHSIDFLCTSPPFLGQRSYLPNDHPDKHLEIGSESNPAAFLSVMLALTREWRRILAPYGSIAIELGDKYSGSGGAGGDYDEDGLREGQPKFGRTEGPGWPLDKSLCGIPTLYPWSLAYGRNLLNPTDTIDPWRVRNLIVWHRPNPPVGQLGDKVRPSTSYITVACTAKDRWFDLDAERTPHKEPPPSEATAVSRRRALNRAAPGNHTEDAMEGIAGNPAGAPPLDCWTDIQEDVWTIPTQPYKGAHYATFPTALPRKLINLMCPRQVCTVCGEPRRRIVEQTDEAYTRVAREAKEGGLRRTGSESGAAMGYAKGNKAQSLIQNQTVQPRFETVGWTECVQHWTINGLVASSYRRGIVLDPFAGSGTTLTAASELGRDSIGIDLDERNLHLARERIGLFLEEPA
jgi:DNA modification methylase